MSRGPSEVSIVIFAFEKLLTRYACGGVVQVGYRQQKREKVIKVARAARRRLLHGGEFFSDAKRSGR
jgi:hypothetical protein